MRAAIYARVSTEEQVQNFSIENQLEHLRKTCKQQGYHVYKEYIDLGWSGTTIDRPALTKLLNDARGKLFDVVLVYKLDRLFRSNRHMYNTLAEWEERGISVSSVTEPFDTTTTMGKAYLGMASTFAEWERNTFIERSQQGIRKAVESGIYSGGIVAYGYRLNTNTKKLEIDEQEAKVIRDIFGWILEDGQSCITIAKRLNAMGIPTRYAKDGRGVRGKGTAGIWRPGRVCNMLKNPAYKGDWEYGKRSKKRQTIRGICPAIIDEQTFALAQARLKNNNHWSDRTRRKPYLLRGLIRCNICGHNYTGCTSRTSNNRELSYYRCNMTINRGNLLGEKCPSPTIRADTVEELVWHQICEIIQNPEVATKALQDKFDACNQAEYVAELVEFKHRLEELKEAEQRLLVKYADPATNFTEEAFDGALQEVRTNGQVIQDRIKDLEKAMINEGEKRRRLNDVTEILDILRRNIRDASFETKRKVCELLVKEIRVGRNGDGATMLNIVYYFNKDWIQGDLKFELLTARAGVHCYLG